MKDNSLKIEINFSNIYDIIYSIDFKTCKLASPLN